jgi:hypothetical protein
MQVALEQPRARRIAASSELALDRIVYDDAIVRMFATATLMLRARRLNRRFGALAPVSSTTS